jgi:hypothetical protein
MSEITIQRNDRKLPFLEYLKLEENFSIADTFLKILDLIGNLELK